MSDLISRQAAIEVLRNRWLKTRNYEGIGEDIAEECEIYLKTLPSAQPTVDAVPVIRCKDCGQREYGCSTFIDHNQIYGFCAWAWKAERKDE